MGDDDIRDPFLNDGGDDDLPKSDEGEVADEVEEDDTDIDVWNTEE